MLNSTKTGRFHPISFKLAPFPGGGPEQTVFRFRSIGHHEPGFETEAEAMAYITENAPQGMRWINQCWGWDETDVPTLTIMLSKEVAGLAAEIQSLLSARG
jgi:hypothetical protein